MKRLQCLGNSSVALGLRKDPFACPLDIFALDFGFFLIRDACDFAKCYALEAVSQGLKSGYLSLFESLW